MNIAKCALILLFGCLATMLMASPVLAADEPEGSLRQDDRLLLNEIQAARLNLRVSKDYALGLTKYHHDHETEMLGWQVSKSLYFGRQRGEDSGLTLVWHQQNNQVSLSKDGLRLTRRF